MQLKQRSNMNLFRSILHDLALVMLVIAGALGCAVLYKALKIEGDVNAALVTVNTPKSGTLSMLDDTIYQGRLTIDAMNKVILHEQTQLGTIDGYARNMDAEISGLVTHVNTTLDSVSGSATQVKETLSTLTGHITPILDSANTTVTKAGEAVDLLKPIELNTAKSMADLDLSLVDVPAVVANAKNITYNFGQTTYDFQLKFHEFMFPAPCLTKWCKVQRTWPYVKGAASLAEPFYWGQQLFENHIP